MSEKATRETWAKRVERWKDSGLSAREFASELGISEPSLKWWKWKLAAEASGAPTHERKRRRTIETEKPTVTFVEVPRAASRRPSIEIVLPSRIRVRLCNEFDASALERVLGVLEARR